MFFRALKHKRIADAVLAVLFTLAGCASEAVVDMGAGNYTVTGYSMRGLAAARQEAVELANEHCGKMKRKTVVQSFQDTMQGSYISSIIFSCAAP